MKVFIFLYLVVETKKSVKYKALLSTKKYVILGLNVNSSPFFPRRKNSPSTSIVLNELSMKNLKACGKSA